MMSFDQFQNALISKCRAFAKEEGNISVHVAEVKKLSGNYPSLTLMRDGMDLGICFNLNDLYGMYQCGQEVDEILSYVKDHMDDEIPEKDFGTVMDYEKIRNLLFVRISNADANRALLMGVPHRIFEEFAITYHIQVACNEELLGSAMITYEMLEKYGIDEEQLYQDAMRSSQKLFAPDILKFSGGAGRGEMLLVTNSRQLNGAAVMFYPGFMEKLCRKVKEDMYVVPSSMHEMMIFPVSTGENASHLRQVLHDANRDCVSPGETLSENVYFLSGRDMVLRRAVC